VAFEDIYDGYVLIDTSALVALIDDNDQNHDYGVLALKELKADINVRLFVCNLTIYETYTRLRYKFHWAKAEEVWGTISTEIQPRRIEYRASYEGRTREILQNYRAYKLSFHDAGCAAIMIEAKIARVFTFDTDFSIIGFARYPDL